MALKDSGRDPRDHPSRSVFVLLLLACLTVITLDARGGDNSPLDPVRSIAGNIVGPVEAATATAVRPFSDIGSYLRTTRGLRNDVAKLQSENSQLRSTVETAPLDRARLNELDGLTRTAKDTGYSLVAARVVAMGPMQSFSRTVTIDAGTSSGVRADMTVLNNDGLVGRVIRATRTTSTVLLIVDPDSVVGGRLGSNLEIGVISGQSLTQKRDDLNLELVDNSVVPERGDVVATWGSDNGVPYVAGIPIGRVASVVSNPSQTEKRAVITPFVDFTALDVVGVVVPNGTHGDRVVIKADGGIK
ncbi:MAG: rod shape-determining protein MreC [Marmoricola sp.]|nr:rod shape-determining protein MreC [Marmoricola sp.]